MGPYSVMWLEKQYSTLYKKEISEEIPEEDKHFIKEFSSTMFPSKTVVVILNNLYRITMWCPIFLIKSSIDKEVEQYLRVNASKNIYSLHKDISKIIYYQVLEMYLTSKIISR